MKNLEMYCITLEPNHYDLIKGFGYTPVGLGEKVFNDKWLSDKVGLNISHKNKFYGEYTFHYWLWKNYLDKIDSRWIGFCQYRKFWSLDVNEKDHINLQNLTKKILKEIPKRFEEYETILVKPEVTNKMKLTKFLKKGLKIIIKNPSLLFNKNKRNINFQFDLMHGFGNLNKAIDLLDKINRESFRDFVNTKTSFNPQNMIICKSKENLKKYYEILFPWLDKCEKIFGFKDLTGYGKTRIYGFLAERFMSYWFQKNTKYTTMPIVFYDIREDLN